MSLKSELYNFIKSKRSATYGECIQFALELGGYKGGTTERRLRDLTTKKNKEPDITPYYAKSRKNTDYIAGYKWVGEPVKEPVNHTGPAGFNFIYKVDPKHALTPFNPPN